MRPDRFVLFSCQCRSPAISMPLTFFLGTSSRLSLTPGMRFFLLRFLIQNFYRFQNITLTANIFLFSLETNVTKVMTEGVATFSGLSLDRSGRNLKLRFSLYGYDRRTGNWNETGVHLDTDFFHVGEGMPASLNLEQVILETIHIMRGLCTPCCTVLLSYRSKHYVQLLRRNRAQTLM